MATRIINRPSIKIEVKDGKYKPFIFDNGKKRYLNSSDEPVPPEPVGPTNRILYTVVEGGSKPASTWITEHCSDNVFDESTDEGYLVLKEGVTELTEYYDEEKEIDYTIFNEDDGGGDTNILSVTIPTQIISIGENCFNYYNNLESVIIPDSVTSIGNSAFQGCSGLTSVTLPSSITSIKNSVFAGCSNLTHIIIPNSVTIIGESAFRESGLVSVSIPNSVTIIEGQAFSNCNNLTSISIPNTIEVIGNGTFAHCDLVSIIIPSSVSIIDSYAFQGCSSLVEVKCYNPIPPTIDYEAFSMIDTTECQVPAESITAYQNSRWADYFTTFTAIQE